MIDEAQTKEIIRKKKDTKDKKEKRMLMRWKQGTGNKEKTKMNIKE